MIGRLSCTLLGAAWETVAGWGLEGIGDYGAFWWQMGVSGAGYFGPAGGYPARDDGTAMLTALTKCDADSWCAGTRSEPFTFTPMGFNSISPAHRRIRPMGRTCR